MEKRAGQGVHTKVLCPGYHQSSDAVGAATPHPHRDVSHRQSNTKSSLEAGREDEARGSVARLQTIRGGTSGHGQGNGCPPKLPETRATFPGVRGRSVWTASWHLQGLSRWLHFSWRGKHSLRCLVGSWEVLGLHSLSSSWCVQTQLPGGP